MAQAISVRLNDAAIKALRALEAAGMTRSQAVRTALVDASKRLRQRCRSARGWQRAPWSRTLMKRWVARHDALVRAEGTSTVPHGKPSTSWDGSGTEADSVSAGCAAR